MLKADAAIGIIGGSGFYSLLSGPKLVEESTQYGKPSSAIAVGTMADKTVAFLQRHGSKHTIPPHMVPYRANIDALAKLGVKRIVATGACGSVSSKYKPGDFVFFDQFFNMTQGRKDTFFDQDTVMHVSPADPYCPELRSIAIKTAKSMRLSFHDKGTIVVVNGPRFSTRAESMFFTRQGFHTINMTQYPEVMLARERQLCYLGIGLVTDYDVGLVGKKGVEPVSNAEVMNMFSQNIEKVKGLIERMLPLIPDRRRCPCGRALDGALATQK